MRAFEELVTWRESLTSGDAIAAAVEVAARDAGAARDMLEGAERIVVTGAGSSYYLALVVAAAARRVLRRSVMAVPLSELLLRPEGVLVDSSRAGAPEPVVVMSRSGSTSEAVAVAERMRAAGHPTIAVTCRASSPLARGADVALVSPAGDESAIVMTRSFASMLALQLGLIGALGGDGGLTADLAKARDHWSEASAAAVVGRRLGETDWSRVVILGGGAAFGLAAEWGLKL